MNTSKLGGTAALTQTAITIANIVVAMGVLPALGFTSMADLSDPATALALKTPLLLLEVFKIASAIVIGLTIFAVSRRLRVHAPTLITLTTVIGFIGVLLLAVGGVIGIGALNSESASAASLSGLINLLGTLSISLIGLWIIIVNGTARQFKLWSNRWGIFGIVLGVASLPVPLLPPLALLTLIFGLIWWPWLGLTLWREA